MGDKAKGGKKNRKHGRQARSAAFQRYWSKPKGHPEFANRAELHAARRARRHAKMVAESKERKARERARANTEV